MLYLSAYFERNREEYQARLLAVSQHGEWEAWLEFFLKGVVEQAYDAVNRSKLLLDLWQGYRSRLQTERGSTLILKILDELFQTPYLNVAVIAQRFGKTFRSVQLHVERLVKEGILVEITGRTRDRVYMAPDIMQVLGA